jgi:hypothetical protein
VANKWQFGLHWLSTHILSSTATTQQRVGTTSETTTSTPFMFLWMQSVIAQTMGLSQRSQDGGTYLQIHSYRKYVKQVIPCSTPNMYFTFLQPRSMIICNGELCFLGGSIEHSSRKNLEYQLVARCRQRVES